MKKGWGFFLCLVVLNGCTLYQNPNVPPVNMPENFKYQVDVTTFHLNDRWWENFNDPCLNKIVEMALLNNFDYLVALKNVDIAQTYVSQNASGLFPQINLEFNSSRNKSQSALNNANNFTTGSSNPNINSGTGLGTTHRIFNLEQLFATVNYEVDIWNQIGNSVKQAKSVVVSNMAQANVIKLSLLSNVITTYFQIQTINENIGNLRDQYQATTELLHVNRSQYRGKVTNVANVEDTYVQLENTAIAIKILQKQRETLVNYLAYLVGTFPEEFVYPKSDSFRHIHYLGLIPPGVPAEIVMNRPDVQSEYYQALSNGYVQKETIANFLPSFVFTGTYGYASNSFKDLFSSTNNFWNYGIMALQPIFDYQLRWSEYQRANFLFQSAILSYQESILYAFQEIDNALISYKEDMQSLIFYRKEIQHLKNLLSIADAQYKSGYGDYATYINYKLSLLQDYYNLNNQQFTVIQDVIQVYKTFGLGLCSTGPCG